MHGDALLIQALARAPSKAGSSCEDVHAGDATSAVSKPGGAGHALLFRDQILVKKDFKVRAR